MKLNVEELPRKLTVNDGMTEMDRRKITLKKENRMKDLRKNWTKSGYIFNYDKTN